MNNQHTVYIGLGSNLGDRQSNLIEAIHGLRERVAIDQLSSIYETEPAYYLDQPFFLNMVCRGQTDLAPDQLLRFLQRLERRLGRQTTVRFGPRPIDLDILLYDDQIIEQEELIIPHPRLAERPFVLVPLAEIAPDLVPPGFDKSVAELAKRGDIHSHGKVVRSRGSLTTRFERDVQNELPAMQIGLSRVGVTNMQRVIRITDANGRESLFSAELNLFVELNARQKGAHMSRFSDTVEEALEEISAQEGVNIESLAERLARQLVVGQHAARSDVEIHARFPLTRRAPISGKLTQEIYTLIGMAAATQTNVVRLVGVEAEGMMACPCAQDMVATAARQALEEEGLPREVIDRVLAITPVATHNQRGRGTLIVGTDQLLRAEDLVGIVEAAMSSETYDLLKRPDELFVVGKAHRHPRFVEDAVREMLCGVIEQYPELPDWSFLYAKQVNFESIHKHDVYAERAATATEVRREMAGDVFATPISLAHWLDQRLGLRG